MRYARRRLNRKVQESKRQDGAPMRVSGPNGSECFAAEGSAGYELVPLCEIALVRKETRKHTPGGDGL